MNPASAAIMNLYRGELKHMVHTENIEENEREILVQKLWMYLILE